MQLTFAAGRLALVSRLSRTPLIRSGTGARWRDALHRQEPVQASDHVATPENL
jgi:hypothetical protein